MATCSAAQRTARDSQGHYEHYAMYYRGRIHFDPWHLAQAAGGTDADLRDLLNSMLHESAHALGHSHSTGPDGRGDYVDPPFDLLTPPQRQQPPGGDSCIRY